LEKLRSRLERRNGEDALVELVKVFLTVAEDEGKAEEVEVKVKVKLKLVKVFLTVAEDEMQVARLVSPVGMKEFDLTNEEVVEK